MQSALPLMAEKQKAADRALALVTRHLERLSRDIELITALELTPATALSSIAIDQSGLLPPINTMQAGLAASGPSTGSLPGVIAASTTPKTASPATSPRYPAAPLNHFFTPRPAGAPPRRRRDHHPPHTAAARRKRERERARQHAAGSARRRQTSSDMGGDGAMLLEEEDKQLYCTCRQVSFGEMVACDGEVCAVHACIFFTRRSTASLSGSTTRAWA